MSTNSVNLIVDSCADFNPDVVKRLNLEVVSFPYLIDGQEYSDDLWASTTPKEFYEKAQKAQSVSTCAVTPGTYFDVFERAAKKGVPTVYLGMTEGLSCSIENARTSKEMIHEKYPDFELYVVDNKVASAAGELLALEAVRQIELGLSAQELALWLEDARYFMHGYFMLENFDALAKGGRIPAAAQITGKLDIKPVLSYGLNGALTLKGMCRGRKKALKSMIEYFVQNRSTDSSLPIAIVNADAEKDAKWLENHIRKIKGLEGIVTIHSSVSPVLGCHTGSGMVAICFWGVDRRKQIGLTDKIAHKVKKHFKKSD